MNEDSKSSKSPVEKTLESLKKDYVAVSVKNLKPWQAWLELEALIGVVLGVALIANENGKVEKREAAATY